MKKKLDLNDFREYIREKKCICFGTGLQGIRIINIFENWGKTNDILAFIDNDSSKWGKVMTVDNFQYPIIPLSSSIQMFQQNVVLIITCADFLNIEKQLEEYREIENVACFSLVEIGQCELAKSNYESVVREHNTPVIPKTIHYCWFGGEMPQMLRENVEQWKKICPDYDIIEWNAENYNVNKILYMKQAYELKKWGYVPDYVRLDLIYQYGGLYLDTDVKIVRRPDDLLYQDSFACFDSSLFMNLGAGFGAKAGTSIIKQLRDYYNDMEFCLPDGSYNRTSCMTHSYNVLRRHGLCINDTLQKVGDLNIYPMIIQGACPYTRQMRITKKTFFLHYGTTTWLDKKNKDIKDEIGEAIALEKQGDLKSYNFLMY